MFNVAPHQSSDLPEVEILLDRVFGADRQSKKTSYRFRQGVAPLGELGMTVRDGKELVGTIRYWPVTVGGAPALLLGPLAVAPERRGEGIGLKLVQRSLLKARRAGHGTVVLVGDRDYYSRFGFEPAGPYDIWMAGEPSRLMVRFLGTDRAKGQVEPWNALGAVIRAA